MGAEVVSIFDRRHDISPDQPADPAREKQRETQRTHRRVEFDVELAHKGSCFGWRIVMRST